MTGRGDISRATLATVPWWIYLAGFVGTLFVAGGVVIAPVTGAQLFFISVIAGQLIGATLADHFGLFGLAVRSLSLERVLGLALVLGGAAAGAARLTRISAFRRVVERQDDVDHLGHVAVAEAHGHPELQRLQRAVRHQRRGLVPGGEAVVVAEVLEGVGDA